MAAAVRAATAGEQVAEQFGVVAGRRADHGGLGQPGTRVQQPAGRFRGPCSAVNSTADGPEGGSVVHRYTAFQRLLDEKSDAALRGGEPQFVAGGPEVDYGTEPDEMVHCTDVPPAHLRCQGAGESSTGTPESISSCAHCGVAAWPS